MQAAVRCIRLEAARPISASGVRPHAPPTAPVVRHQRQPAAGQHHADRRLARLHRRRSAWCSKPICPPSRPMCEPPANSCSLSRAIPAPATRIRRPCVAAQSPAQVLVNIGATAEGLGAVSAVARQQSVATLGKPVQLHAADMQLEVATQKALGLGQLAPTERRGNAHRALVKPLAAGKCLRWSKYQALRTGTDNPLVCRHDPLASDVMPYVQSRSTR